VPLASTSASKYAPVSHRNSSAPGIFVGIANGTIARSSASTQLMLKNLPPSAWPHHAFIP
jgi:hypothetical protein